MYRYFNIVCKYLQNDKKSDTVPIERDSIQSMKGPKNVQYREGERNQSKTEV